MPYVPDWSTRAARQYLFWQKHEPRVAGKIDELMDAVELDPFSGIGKPKYLNGYWSRRITEKHRLFYKVIDGKVLVLSCYGHEVGDID
jgi:toxin YoeB